MNLNPLTRTVGTYPMTLRQRISTLGHSLGYKLTALNYQFGLASPKRTPAGMYWSYELRNSHGNDHGLAVLASLEPGATIFDIGAHVGEYSIPLQMAGHHVFGFEPNALSINRFQQNCLENDVSINISHQGISDHNGTQNFYRSSFSKLSAFDQNAATRWGATIESSVEIPVNTLDSLIEEDYPVPEAIKIDVEGHEWNVLQGAESVLSTAKPLVVLEYHSSGSTTNASEIKRWFLSKGYSVETVDNTYICRPSVNHNQCDLFL